MTKRDTRRWAGAARELLGGDSELTGNASCLTGRSRDPRLVLALLGGGSGVLAAISFALTGRSAGLGLGGIFLVYRLINSFAVASSMVDRSDC